MLWFLLYIIISTIDEMAAIFCTAIILKISLPVISRDIRSLANIVFPEISGSSRMNRTFILTSYHTTILPDFRMFLLFAESSFSSGLVVCISLPLLLYVCFELKNVCWDVVNRCSETVNSLFFILPEVFKNISAIGVNSIHFKIDVFFLCLSNLAWMIYQACF